MRALGYAWEEAVVSLRRGRWGLVLSIATITVTFAILGAFRVVSDNVARVADGWTSAAEMSIYLDDVVTDAELTALRQALERDPATARATLVSKEEALARFGAEFPELADVTSSFQMNPFPASFDVRLKPESVAATAPALAASAAKMPGVVDVRYDQRWLSRLVAVLSALRTAGWVTAIALILGAATTVVSVVRLSFETRRDEIGIMGLVGAPVSYIRGPFIMEGAVQGVLGSLLSLGALALLGRALGQAMGPGVTALGPAGLQTLGLADAATLVALGAAVGGLAGLLATWRWDPDSPIDR